jgi:putative redox protein
MSSILEVSCHLVNDKLHFIGNAEGRKPVDIDYIPPLGDNLGYMPLQLLLLSLASCVGGTVLPLLRRMGKTISGLDVKASGIRRDQHPTSFEKITLEFTLQSVDAQPADVDKALALAEETYCPVWAMVKGNVEVETKYTIVP